MLTILLIIKLIGVTIMLNLWETEMFNEFLVLGQVPGTSFQITFNELLLLLDIGLLMLLLQMRQAVFTKINNQIYYFRLYFSVKYGQQLKLRV